MVLAWLRMVQPPTDRTYKPDILIGSVLDLLPTEAGHGQTAAEFIRHCANRLLGVKAANNQDLDATSALVKHALASEAHTKK